MSSGESKDLNERFGRLLASIALVELKCVAEYSRRLGDPPTTGGQQPSYAMKQARGHEDPLRVGQAGLLFRTRFDFKASYGESAIFEQYSEYFTSFSIQDQPAFEAAWTDEEVRGVFFDRQLKRTLWPFVREQVQYGMLRVGLQALTLPWIV